MFKLSPLLALSAQQQQQQIPQQQLQTAHAQQRLKCGEVYTWDCAGELYGVECALCEEKPLCSLQEFAEHMQIWHTDWEAVSENGCKDAETAEIDDGAQQQLKEFEALYSDNEESDFSLNDDYLEPFEEVLITRDGDDNSNAFNAETEVVDYFTDDEITCRTTSVASETYAESMDLGEIDLRSTTTEQPNNNDDIATKAENKTDESEIAVHAFSDSENASTTIASSETYAEYMQLTEDLQNNTMKEFSEHANTEMAEWQQSTNKIEVTFLHLLDSKLETKDYFEYIDAEQKGYFDYIDKKCESNEMQLPESFKDDDSLWEYIVGHEKEMEQPKEEYHPSAVYEQRNIDSTEMIIETGSTESESLLNDINENITNFKSLEDPTTFDILKQIKYGLNESTSNKKLTSDQIGKLIELYKAQPRLWNQTHAEFSETRLNRSSWQEITRKWNEYCKTSYTTTDVSLRVSSLCQRYLKERERLQMDDEWADDKNSFIHYEKMKFLDEQQVLKKRRDFYEEQNVKLLEIYQHFPVLWHSNERHRKQPVQRKQALQGISNALRLYGIHLSPFAVQGRLQSLRSCYRAAKMRYLHSRVQHTSFEANFKHYAQMQFIDQHIEPHLCKECGKIFENTISYREHLNNENHNEEITAGNHKNSDETALLEQLAKAQNDDLLTITSTTMDTIDEIALIVSHNEVSSTTTTTTSEIIKTDEDKSKQTNKENEISVSIGMQNDIIACKDDNAFNVKCSNNIIISATLTQDVIVDALDAHTSEPNEAASLQNEQQTQELVVNVQCANFSYNLKVDSNTAEEEKVKTDELTGTKEKQQKNENMETFARLTAEQTHKLIAIYSLYPQLWNTQHLDFNSRKLRRIAWRALTSKLNEMYKMRYSWKTLYRKLTDYIKYYKREKKRIEMEGSCTKWCFYDDFAFLDKVINNTSELRTIWQANEKNLNIITAYKLHSQLWDTKHADFTKHKRRQVHIEALRVHLLKQYNIELSISKLKQRLIEYRCNYRRDKLQRIAALKRNETFTPSYEYYEHLQFLEPHVAPFTCTKCPISFERLRDYLRHEHGDNGAIRNSCTRQRRRAADLDSALENICHICGIKFTLRSNLVYHLKRHLGQATYACSMCPKKFYNSTALCVHERTHTRDYPFVCEECGGRFINMSKLNQHMKRHRNQKDHKCDQCDKTFYTAFERDYHIRRHLNIRDKICPICGKTFYVGSSYYAHMLLHSDVKRYECKICGLKFAQYAGLYKHRKNHHTSE